MGKIRPRLTEETKQYQQQQFPRKKFNQQQQQQFYLSFSFCFYSFSYTLFSSLGLWFGFRALPEGVSEVLFFEKRAIFFLFVFCRFSVVFP
jgi:hypothetical protein